jgi:thioredoxin-related protein
MKKIIAILLIVFINLMAEQQEPPSQEAINDLIEAYQNAEDNQKSNVLKQNRDVWDAFSDIEKMQFIQKMTVESEKRKEEEKKSKEN